MLPVPKGHLGRRSMLFLVDSEDGMKASGCRLQRGNSGSVGELSLTTRSGQMWSG